MNELIEEIEKERDSYGWDKYTMNMFKDIIDIAKSILPKESQNLIDAADSKFVILEKVIDSNGAKVTYQSGKDYVKDKFGI